MAAALKAVAAARSAAATAAASGLRRMSSLFPGFNPPPPANPPPKAEPSTNLFISGLSKRTTSEGLREAFSKFGEVIHARVVTDRVSGYSKGFGFVRYTKLEDAEAGIKGMDGKFLDGWVIFAEYARPRPPPAAVPENSQPSSSYQSQSSHNSYYKNVMPGNPQSQPSYNTYNAAPGNPESPPYNSYNNAATENSTSPPPPSFQYNNYNGDTFNNPMPGNPQSQPSYNTYKAAAPGNLDSPPYNSYNNAATENSTSPPPPSFQYNNYNGDTFNNPVLGNPEAERKHQYGSDNNPAAKSPSSEPVPYGGHSNPETAQSEPVYQYTS